MKVQAILVLVLLDSSYSDWKPFLNDSQPSLDGVSGGFNQNSEEIFVGLATYKAQKSPAELIISGENVGLYFPYGKSVQRLRSDLKYYVKESDCEYKWVASSNGGSVYNAIQVLSPPYTFYVGRVSSFDSYHVGNVNLQHRVFYYGFNGTTRTSASYKVLTCKRSHTTISPRGAATMNSRGISSSTLKARMNEFRASKIAENL